MRGFFDQTMRGLFWTNLFATAAFGFLLGITRTEIVGNSMIMMIGGYETTATTMTILAYCIATEPEVQEKLYQEIVETTEKYVSCPTGRVRRKRCFFS